MRQLGLRSRLLLAVGVVAVVNVVAAVVVISVASDQFLDQIDEQLLEATSVEGRPVVGNFYQGVLSPDGQLTTLVPLADRGRELPPPEIGLEHVAAATAGPVTVDALTGQSEYRVLVMNKDGETLVVGSDLNGYEFSVNRLTSLVAASSMAMVGVLAAVAWWVLRLGVRPIKKMTLAAEVIASGDLSERIDEVDPGTEAGQLGLALNTMMGRIEQSFDERTRAEERLRQFVADASHELRTPVATIRGYTELYRAGGLEDRHELDDAMRRTGEESERMSRLVVDMLNLAKLDRSPEPRFEPVELVSLSRDVVADALAANEGRTIEAELPSEPVMVDGDEDLLRQAASNLVGNVLVHNGADTKATVTLGANEGFAELSVADDGRGMTREVAARATERFFRADPSRSRQRGGSGLGLAIVASVVEAHRGSLTIESVLGEGTTVSIRLPLAGLGSGK